MATGGYFYVVNRNLALFSSAIAIIVATFVLVAPWPQPPSYHEFADTRTIAGIANFWNVASNIAFLVPGIAGLRYLSGPETPGLTEGTRTTYRVLFAGLVLTAIGSSWYHLAPANETLVWDRLPMTIISMTLTAAIIAEFVSLDAGRKLLWPLLLTGFASVIYWSWTEAHGNGDLRPYGLVIFLPLIFIPAIVLTSRSPFDSNQYLLHALGLYLLAKLAEHFDQEIFAVGQLLSGHAIKHLFAAAALWVLLRGIISRRPLRHD